MGVPFLKYTPRFPRPTDADEYVVLSGQHSLLAMRRRAEDYEKDLLQVPKELQMVSATILAPNTPPAVRELAAGDAQATQATIRELTIPEFARLLLKEWQRDPAEGTDKGRQRLALAYRKSGWDRSMDIVCPLPCPSCPFCACHALCYQQ